MSSSKSNNSNDSSRSNILTLSQDSSSSQIKSHKANIYYQKFISKLGFLFRIDTKDLDALYNKIVQCVNSNEQFAQSKDADIVQLIQLAKKLRQNHNLLKNMVEVLDQRFIQKSISPKKQTKFNEIKLNQQIQNPNFVKQKLNKYESTTIPMKKKRFQLSKYAPIQGSTQDLSPSKDVYIQIYSRGINNKKEQELMQDMNQKKKLSQPVVNPLKNKVKYEQRVGRIFQQMNNIKRQLHKIQNQSQNNKNYSPTQNISQGQNKNQNNYIQNEDQVFMKMEDDTYYLADNKYMNTYKNEYQQESFRQGQKIQQNIPKLSLKDLYNKMGINPYQLDSITTNSGQVSKQNQRNKSNGMIQIKQTSRQNQDFFDIPSAPQINLQQNRKYILNSSNYLIKAQQNKNNRGDLTQQDIYKQKQISNSTSLGNLTNATNITLQGQVYPQEKRYYQTRKLIRDVYQEQQNYINGNNGQQGGSSQKSQTISNRTIIDKITTPFYLHNKIQKDSISTNTVQNNQTEKNKWESNNRNSESQNIPKENNEFRKKSSFYTQILQRNQKSRQKINNYLSRLDQRNKILNSYVKKMQKSLGKEKNMKQQQNIQTQSNNRPLSNQVYVQNEIVVPKYIPKASSQKMQPKDGLNNRNSSLLSIKQTIDRKSQTEQINISISQINKNKKQDKSKFLYPSQPIQQKVQPLRQQIQKNNIIVTNQIRSQLHQAPFLRSLVQNIQNRQQLPIQFKYPKYQPEHKIQKKEVNNQNQKKIIKKIPKQDHEISLQITSKNSIEDRMEASPTHHSNQHNILIGISNQFVIPRMTTHSLFEQTRNVESKIQLSEDRSYKMKIPGEQIQKIKNRVNQMFNRMKSIENNSNNPKQLQIPEQTPIKQQSSNKSKQKAPLLSTSSKPQIKKFQIKAPQNKIHIATIKQPQYKLQKSPNHRVLQNSVYQSINNNYSSIIHRIDPPKPQMHQQRFYLHSFNHSYPVNNSLIITNPPTKDIPPVRLSFLYDSHNNTNKDHQNIQINNKISNVVSNSRQSSFSFQNKFNKFGQDSIRSSLSISNNQIILPAKALPVEPISSSRENKQIIQPQSPNHYRGPILNRIMINRPPSTRSSSNQSKSSIVKPVKQIKVIRNAPPLPPRVQSPKNIMLLPLNISQPVENRSSATKRIQNVSSTPTLLTQIQKPRYNIVKEQSSKNCTSKCIDIFCPEQNKGKSQYYSSAALNQSYVSKYSNSYIPHNQHYQNNSSLTTIPFSNQKTGIQTYSNRYQSKVNQQFERRQISRHDSKSSSRSHRSKKGIGVSLKQKGQLKRQRS